MTIELKNIPVVILAGGRGARFDHESQVKPKPMIEVVGQPMLRQIIDGFISQGFREFIVATGYLGEQIREYFDAVGSKFSFDEDEGIQHTVHHGIMGEPIFVKCYDTGLESNTGDRVRKLKQVIDGRRFVLTYGDGLSDVNMADVLDHHDWAHKSWEQERLTGFSPPLVTMTAVRPPGRFGVLEVVSDGEWSTNFAAVVKSFEEKPAQGLINGGFMVVEPGFITQYLEPYGSLEGDALRRLASDGLMQAVVHGGYWRCMDTRRDLEQIEQDVLDGDGRLPWLREKK